MIRFDEGARRLSLSVRDLAQEVDHRFAGPAPLGRRRRAELGRVAHEEHQGAREEALGSYRRERSIRWEARVAGWSVVVSGRIDGVYTDPAGRTVIEEVKTIVGSPEELERAGPDDYPDYVRQLQLYRFLLEEGAGALEFGGAAPEIALHLCLIALPGRASRVLALGYDHEACRALVHRRLGEVLAARDAARRREARRQALSRALAFPHEAPRPHQAAMVEAIDEALARGRDVLVSAPTGVGKTAGALLPALRHAARRGGRVFVATSKSTQQAIFARTVELLRARGAPVRAVVLQAREKGCLNEVVHCHPDACPWARDHQRKLERSGAADRLLERGLADPEAVRAEALAHGFCPVEASLDLVDEVEVVIGDYNYAFDPGATLKRLFVDEEPADVVLVIDEAHNLYERGVAHGSPELPLALVREVRRALARGQGDPGLRPLEAQALEVTDRVIAWLEAIDAGGAGGVAGAAPGALGAEPAGAAPAPDAPPENLLLFDDPAAATAPRRRRPAPPPRAPASAPEAPPPGAAGATGSAPAAAAAPDPEAARLPDEREVALDPGPLLAARDALAELSVAWFVEGRARGVRTGDDPVPLLHRAVARVAAVLEQWGPEMSAIWRRRAGGALKLLCKDPARQLGRRIRACGGAVAVSATLEPLAFYRDVLGFPPDAALLRFPSPFDPARRRVLVLDRPSTSYRLRDRDLPIVEDAVRAVVAARPGNYLVACPSFDYLDKLAPRLEHLPGFEVVAQARAMDEPSRLAVLARLDEAAAGRRPPQVLVAVQGGIFTEGVDYPGARCIGAIVVGPGLPRVGFERALIEAHFQRTRGRGFEYAFLYPGMSRVIQAAGRVIRTPEDEGVIVLVGDRFATPRYTALFPRDWYVRDPRELVCDDPYGALRGFWRARAEARELADAKT